MKPQTHSYALSNVSNGQENEAFAAEAENQAGLGHQLRRAREHCKLSIAAVAAQLHVKSWVIEALEEESFERLPVPVYVRGYLRNYARLVNLPAEPVIETYNRMFCAEPAPLPSQIRDKADPQLHPQLRWGVYFLALGFIGLIFFWAYNKGSSDFGETNKHRQAVDKGPTSSQPPLMAQRTDPAISPSQAAEPLVTRTFDPKPQPQPSEARTASNTPASTPVLTDIAAVNSPPMAEPPTPVTAQKTATPPATPSIASPSPSQSQEPGPDNLSVHVSADSWVAIRDHNGRRLSFETLPAGTDRTYSGQAPFAVVLGNSPATRLEFNGQPFNQAKYNAGIVARFKLGK